MQSQDLSKLHSPANKQKIFNVRKRAHKPLDKDKYLKYTCSPVLKKEPFQNIQNVLSSSNKMEYHYQLAIMASPKYKQLEQKYRQLKQKQKEEKQMKMQILMSKQNQLKRYILERQRLINERQRLDEKRQQIKQYIDQMRQQRQIYHLQNRQRSEIYQAITAEQLKSTIMALQYQGGIDIDTDNMTYQELLQLQEKMGKVSKGLSEEQFQRLQTISAEKQHEQEVCSICCEGIQEKEQVHQLRCRHIYHCSCIKQWFTNEKTCPLCKQEVFDA